MQGKITVEICACSIQDALAASKGGADRIELCSAAFFGGLTPSVGTLKACKAGQPLPVMAMVRPREGGFCYDKHEKDVMLRDAESLLSAGADGLVFGALTPGGAIDLPFIRQLAAIAAGRQTVFHRAFDLAPLLWKENLDALIEAGITRVLTSGFAATAPEGREAVRRMAEYANKRIEILPGSGLRPGGGIGEFLAYTGCTQIHSSGGRRAYTDPSALLNPAVAFTGYSAPKQGEYTLCDAETIKKLVSEVENL